jgi:hypothetical protein
MQELNLPPHPFRIRSKGQSTEIFDSIRKKFVMLTPEEWVRQHFIMFIQNELKYPQGVLSVEKGFLVNGRPKRADIVVHDRAGLPWMIVECKAPEIKLTEEVFYQAAGYHLKLNVSYLAVTNGIQHYCCKFAGEKFEFIKGFPPYPI